MNNILKSPVFLFDNIRRKSIVITSIPENLRNSFKIFQPWWTRGNVVVRWRDMFALLSVSWNCSLWAEVLFHEITHTITSWCLFLHHPVVSSSWERERETSPCPYPRSISTRADAIGCWLWCISNGVAYTPRIQLTLVEMEILLCFCARHKNKNNNES